MSLELRHQRDDQPCLVHLRAISLVVRHYIPGTVAPTTMHTNRQPCARSGGRRVHRARAGKALPFTALSLPFTALSLPFTALSLPFTALSLPFSVLSLVFLRPFTRLSPCMAVALTGRCPARRCPRGPNATAARQSPSTWSQSARPSPAHRVYTQHRASASDTAHVYTRNANTRATHKAAPYLEVDPSDHEEVEAEERVQRGVCEAPQAIW